LSTVIIGERAALAGLETDDRAFVDAKEALKETLLSMLPCVNNESALFRVRHPPVFNRAKKVITQLNAAKVPFQLSADRVIVVDIEQIGLSVM
jgi:hypothetical protein